MPDIKTTGKKRFHEAQLGYYLPTVWHSLHKLLFKLQLPESPQPARPLIMLTGES